jgi:hypothetical protein
MPQFSFGSGFLYGIPSGTNPTPVLFGTLQDVSLDISFTIKKLMGQFQAPVAVARGAASYTGKAKAASISSQAYNTIFTGVAGSTGGLQVVNGEAFAPAAGTYTVAVSPTTLTDDLGVIYAATGISLKRVASAPTVGQYSFVLATGVYTFNATDNTVPMQVSYAYNSTTLGQSIVYANQLMGSAPSFSLVLTVPFNQFGTTLTYKFYNAISTKLSFDFKNEDFTVPEFDFECYANAAGNIYQATFSS